MNDYQSPLTIHTYSISAHSVHEIESVINRIQTQKVMDNESNIKSTFQCDFKLKPVGLIPRQGFKYGDSETGYFFQNLPHNVKPKVVNYDHRDRILSVSCYWMDYVLQLIVNEINQLKQPQLTYQ